MKGVTASAAIISFTNILTVIFKTKLRLWRNLLFFFYKGRVDVGVFLSAIPQHEGEASDSTVP